MNDAEWTASVARSGAVQDSYKKHRQDLPNKTRGEDTVTLGTHMGARRTQQQ